MDGVFSLAGETALITGGGTGLGFGVAKAFAEAGARVILTGRREEILVNAVAEIGRDAAYLVHDVTRFETLDAMLETLHSRFGDVSILVNNAGTHIKKAAIDTTEAEFLSVLNTHVTGAFALTRRLVPAMKANGRGSVLFMASMTSLMGMPLVVAYSAAKSAYLGLVRTLAVELGPSGIRVNAIAPGWIETPMLHKALAGDTQRRDRILMRTPMAKFGAPDDIAWAAVYLSSPAAKFVNGVLLPVDGGASIGF
jgi:gluconate 5-dehydrogenase